MPSHEMKNEPTTSEPAPLSDVGASERLSKVPSKSTVCDFLYHDARRIASFLAQFGTYGVLQGIKASESTSRNQQMQTAIGAKGSVVVADASAKLDQTTGDLEQDAAERTYDPLWVNARDFLAYLDTADLIVENLATARIGQIAQVSGDLSVTDLGVAKSILSLPVVKEMLRKKNSHMNNKEMDMSFAIFNTLPYAVHASVLSSQGKVWAVLKEEFLSVSPSEMFLKHGIKVQGKWNMLGIFDAMPDEVTEETVEAALNKGATESKVPLSQLVENLAPLTRHLLGRPAGAYGMTPLMIYREVSG